MTESEAYTLLLYARRQAAAALRERRLDTALRAVNALVLVDRDSIDYRDLSVDFPLLAVRELGGDLADVISEAAERSSASTRSVFEAAGARASSLTLRSCGLYEVRSAHGVGFMEAWTRDYAPESHMAEIGVTLADALDAEASYRVEEIRIAGLPAVWFGFRRPVLSLPSKACVVVSGPSVGAERPFSHSRLDFLATLPNESEAAILVGRASEASVVTRPRVAISEGERLALFVGGSSIQGEQPVETETTLARFAVMARTILSSQAA